MEVRFGAPRRVQGTLLRTATRSGPRGERLARLVATKLQQRGGVRHTLAAQVNADKPRLGAVLSSLLLHAGVNDFFSIP